MNAWLVTSLIAGAVLILLFYGFRYLLKLSQRPVMEVNLFPAERAKWSDASKASQIADWFQKNKFEPAGVFKCFEMYGLLIAGYVRTSDQMIGILYDHPEAGMWMDIGVLYENGDGLVVSDAPAGESLDHMPGQTKFYLKGHSPDELLQKAVAERRPAGRVRVAKGEFALMFETQYRREMQWRLQRGGPTAEEVARIAEGMDEQPGTRVVQKARFEIHQAWAEEKDRPAKGAGFMFTGELPKEFMDPVIFRKGMEGKSAPLPRLGVPALPVYLALTAMICGWLYFGYRYMRVNQSVTIGPLVAFLAVGLVLIVSLVVFRERHRRSLAGPVLKRIAERLPGAFLCVAGSNPMLYYARDKWLGRLVISEGGETGNDSTRLETILKYKCGAITISKKTFLGKAFGLGEQDAVSAAGSRFAERFAVDTGDAAFARTLLTPALAEAVLRLEPFDKPVIEIDGNLVSIEIRKELLPHRREQELARFLEAADNIVETLSSQLG